MDFRADVPIVAAALAASLVAADGVIEKREKEVAVRLGSEIFGGFSGLTFETLLHDITELPPAFELAATLRQFLDEDGAQDVMRYLVAIANADDRVVEVERQELEGVAKALETSVPEFSAR